MQNNPLAGPAYVVALVHALSEHRRPGAFVTPPPTGGEQISVRLGDNVMVHLDVLAKKSGWTRAQVLAAIVSRGLFDLYEFINDETGEAIMQEIANELVPMMHTESEFARLAQKAAKEIAGDGCTVSPGGRPESFWLMAPRRPKGIPRMLVRVDNQAAGDFQNARQAERELMTRA